MKNNMQTTKLTWIIELKIKEEKNQVISCRWNELHESKDIQYENKKIASVKLIGMQIFFYGCISIAYAWLL